MPQGLARSAALWIALLAAVLSCGGAPRAARAQEPAPETTAPTPIPIPDITGRADEEQRTLASLRAQAEEIGAIAPLEGGIEAVRLEVEQRSAELPGQLERSSGFDSLLRLERVWADLSQRLTEWQTELKRRAGSLEAQLGQLEMDREIWRITYENARDGGGPEVVLVAARATRESLGQTIRLLTTTRDRLLKAQGRAKQTRDDVEVALVRVSAKQEDLLSTLLMRDQPPLWALSESEDFAQIGERVRAEVQIQLDATRALVDEQTERFGLQVILFAVFIAALLAARTRTRRWPREDPHLVGVALVFERPYAVALLASLLLMRSIFVQPPHAVRQLSEMLLLFPALAVLWPITERPVRPALLILGGFYLIDQLRDFVEALPIVERWIFILEMALASTATGWLIARAERGRPPIGVENVQARRAAPLVLRVLLGVFAVAACCAALGFMRLARLLGDGTLGSLYVGVFIYGVLHSVEAIVVFALRSRFVRPIRSVSRHAASVEKFAKRVLDFGGALLWAAIALQLFGLRSGLYRVLAVVLGAQLEIGSLAISLGDVLAFGLTIGGSMLLARAIERVLNEDVYPRLGTARGASYAVSTILRYSILSLGFLAAMSAMGFDMDRLTVLIGAFGVGIGFGLQNVINNFVSGLILLFERPIQLGDAIEVDGVSGTVYRIGIRASVVRTFDGADVTIPNGTLLSQRLVNWTMSDRHRRIEVTFSVPQGSDPDAVFEALREAAAENPNLLPEPAPQPLFTGFNEKLLDFAVRAWVADTDQWVRARSDLVRAIQRRLGKRGIELHPTPPAAPPPASDAAMLPGA